MIQEKQKKSQMMEGISGKSLEKTGLQFQNVHRVLDKDWTEFRHNPQLFVSTIFFPVFFSIVFSFSIVSTASNGNIEPVDLYWSVRNLMGFLKALFLMIPMIICQRLTSDSLAGEKERKTVETLLLLPITRQKLYLGKVAFALIPGLIVTGITFGLMGSIVNLCTYRPEIANLPLLVFGDGSFWALAWVVSPLFSLLIIQLGIGISARASSVKSAQSLSMLLFIPFSLFALSAILGGDSLENPWVLAGLCGILVCLNVVIASKGQIILNKERLISSVT